MNKYKFHEAEVPVLYVDVGEDQIPSEKPLLNASQGIQNQPHGEGGLSSGGT